MLKRPSARRGSNGGRNDFPVAAGTGGKPGTSLIRSAESVSDFERRTRLRHHAARQRETVFKTRDESPTKPVAEDVAWRDDVWF